VRKEKNIPQKEAIQLMIRKTGEEGADTSFDDVVMKLCGIDELTYVDEKQPDAVSFVIKSTEFYIPLNIQADPEEESRKLQEELAYMRGFMVTVDKKLSNERFVTTAPRHVVELERKKKSDAEARIRVLEEKLRSY
jgi:valyl-tRNA synthetase